MPKKIFGSGRVAKGLSHIKAPSKNNQKLNKHWLSNKQFNELPRDNEGNIPLEILIKYSSRIKDTQFARLTIKNIRELTHWQMTGQRKQSKSHSVSHGIPSAQNKHHTSKRWSNN